MPGADPPRPRHLRPAAAIAPEGRDGAVDGGSLVTRRYDEFPGKPS
ncbi:hypothetical protein [Streptomyces bauhiniae]